MNINRLNLHVKENIKKKTKKIESLLTISLKFFKK